MQKTKQDLQIEQQILYNLAQIIESFPQYTVAQHIAHFVRKKNELKEFYFWSSAKVLQKIEEYHDELKDDLLIIIDEDE